MTGRIPSAEDIDRMVDEGTDMTPYIDMATVTKPNRPATRRITLDVPECQLARADFAAARIGVSRRAVINFALDEYLDREDERLRAMSAVTA